MKTSGNEFQFLDFARRNPNPRPEAIQKNGVAPAVSEGSAGPSPVSSKPRANDDGLNAARGILIGSAIGLAIWGALFGVWLLA